jgi:hypothetical protein
VWPFSANSAKKSDASDPRSIESRMRALELDWEDTYERIRKVLQRISKRAESLEKLEAHRDERESASDPQAPGGGSEATYSGRLSPRQREIQQQILRRRTNL